MGIYNVLEDSFFLHLFDQTLCKEISVTQSLCDNVLFLIAGYDSVQLNQVNNVHLFKIILITQSI